MISSSGVGFESCRSKLVTILFPKDMERSENSTPLLRYPEGADWALMGQKRRSAKWEKENYQALPTPTAYHLGSLGLNGPYRELSRGRLFKACWGKRYVAVGSWGEGLRPFLQTPHPRWIIVLVRGRVMQRDVARYGRK